MEKIPVYGDLKAVQNAASTSGEALIRIGKWIAAEDNITKVLEDSVISTALSKVVTLLVDPDASMDLISSAVQCIKLVASKQKANDILREYGALLNLKQLAEREKIMEDYELSTEIGYATAFLQKCTPHAVREIGFGFDKSTGKHAFLLHLKQLSYEQVGVAWRVWDGSILVSRWIYQNPDFFKNKIVLELGAGCGLCGLVAARVASKVALSDIGDEVIKTLRENVELNKSQFPKANVAVTSVDFKSNSFVANPPYLKQQVDIILGSEIMYEVDITEALVKTVNMYLKPGGHFYGVSASYRKGAKIFVEGMKKLGYTVEHQLPGKQENYFNDGDDMLFYHCYGKK